VEIRADWSSAARPAVHLIPGAISGERRLRIRSGGVTTPLLVGLDGEPRFEVSRHYIGIDEVPSEPFRQDHVDLRRDDAGVLQYATMGAERVQRVTKQLAAGELHPNQANAPAASVVDCTRQRRGTAADRLDRCFKTRRTELSPTCRFPARAASALSAVHAAVVATSEENIRAVQAVVRERSTASPVPVDLGAEPHRSRRNRCSKSGNRVGFDDTLATD